FLPQKIELRNLAAGFPDTEIQFTGSADLPRNCGTAEDCTVRLDVRADQLALSDLGAILSPRPHERPWYRMLQREHEDKVLGGVDAMGSIRINRLVFGFGDGAARHLATDFRLRGGRALLDQLSAEVWGGRHQGDWE